MNSSTNRAFLTLIAFLLIFGNFSDVFASGWDVVKPTVGKQVKLQISEKTRRYYELSQTDTTFVEVEGPTTLNILTRAVLYGKKRDVLYGMIVYRDGGDRSFIGRGSSVANAVSTLKKSDQRIAESRSVHFKVPAGKHVYSIILPKEVDKPVYARFLVPEVKKTESNYIAFLPRTFSEEVRLDIREQEYIYYRATSDSPVELDVIGTTRIRGVARLEFDHSIRGDQPYRIQISENNSIISTIPITAKISGTASYVDPGTKVPSRGENFYINVPSGVHKYKISIPDPGISVLFRFYIPQKDLKNSVTPKNTSHTGRFNFNTKS